MYEIYTVYFEFEFHVLLLRNFGSGRDRSAEIIWDESLPGSSFEGTIPTLT